MGKVRELLRGHSISLHLCSGETRTSPQLLLQRITEACQGLFRKKKKLFVKEDFLLMHTMYFVSALKGQIN